MMQNMIYVPVFIITNIRNYVDSINIILCLFVGQATDIGWG